MGSSPLVSQNFADVLDPSFREVASGTYDLGKSRISDFFTVKDSDRASEKYSELTPMGKFVEFKGAVSYDGPDQGYDVSASHMEKALGIQIERKLYDDDQFDIINEQFSQLGDSAFKTQEDDASEIFNLAFSNISDFFTHSEGVALCSNSHTTPRSGVSTTAGFDNLGTAAFSPTALSAARLQMRQLKDASGYKLDILPNKLIIPVDLEDRALEVVKTVSGLDSADQNVNPQQGRFELYVHPRLSDTNDWFVVNSDLMKKNLLWFWRVKLELARMESFDNIIAKARGYMRYSFLRRDWRWVVGNQVS